MELHQGVFADHHSSSQTLVQNILGSGIDVMVGFICRQRPYCYMGVQRYPQVSSSTNLPVGASPPSTVTPD